MKEYPETHEYGMITFDGIEGRLPIWGDIGIQISQDGRIWVCIDGRAFIRFRPMRKEEISDEGV